MSAKFPHLSDSEKFPGIKNVDPYAIKQTFDYTRWEPGTKLKLCNVNWCGDYENVVKFEDDAARDAYFDALETPIHVLDSGMRVLPKQSIKLPVPFDELVNYNYLMVEFAAAPVPFADEHARRFFYFVHDVEFTAANTTSATVELDVWTTYINRIDINYMLLARGHAPVAASNVDEYLANPIANNRYLLAKDVAFGEPAAVQSSEFIPFGSGTKYVLIATTMPRDAFAALGSVDAIAPSNPAFYSTGDRAGADAGINGAQIAAGGIDYSGLNLETDPTASNSGATPNGVSVFAVAGRDFVEFMAAAVAQAPQIIETIQAVFMVDESMIVKGNHFKVLAKGSMTWRQLAATGKTWADLANSGHSYADLDRFAFLYFGTGQNGFDCWEVQPNNEIIKQLHFAKEDFNYPAEYAELAKLYTYPYAAIEVSDSTGNASIIKIEDTGALEIQKRVSLAYPFIRFEAFLSGVGGGEPNEFTWKDLSDREFRESLPGSDFRDFNFGFEIPTFAIYQRGYDRFRLHNYNANNVKALTEKETAYTNDVRSANTAYQNELAAISKAYTNADASAANSKNNANRSALAAFQNAQASNATGQTNANASNAAAFTNAQRSATTAQTNSLSSNATGYTNEISSAETARDTTLQSNDTARTNTRRAASTAKANTDNLADTAVANAAVSTAAAAYKTAQGNSNAATVTRKSNSLNQAIQAWSAGYSRELQNISDAQAFVSMAGQAGVSMLEGFSHLESANPLQANATFAGAINNGIQTIASVAAGHAATEKGIELSQNQVDETSRNSTEIMTENSALALNVTNKDIAVTTATTNNDANATKTNANNSYVTETRNADATRDTGDANAKKNYSTTTANSGRSKDTGDANAQRTFAATVANADNTRGTSNANAQRSRTTADANAQRTYNAAIANADANASLTRSNAQRDRDTARANAGYSRDQAVENAQRTLTAGLEMIRQGYLDHRLDPPIQVGEYAGDPLPDEFKWRGVQVKVKTQKPGEIAPAADQMLRYGYTLGQLWNFTDFNLMQHFTYWQCEDLWLTGGAGVIESAQEAIKNILRRGVTIWSKPDEIGGVSIYDNR